MVGRGLSALPFPPYAALGVGALKAAPGWEDKPRSRKSWVCFRA